MTDMYETQQMTNFMTTAHALPAILIGGPPNSGKSVLTYNLTKALRRNNVPHYVLRAQPDMEGDWFLQEELETVREIRPPFKDYRRWTPQFRDFVCQDLARRRHLPLLVDLGGKPTKDDQCIFRACTHSILLMNDEKKDLSQTWREFAGQNALIPLAEVISKLEGPSILTASKPVIKGTITGLERGKQRIPGPVFEAIVDRITELFSSYSETELENRHLDDPLLEKEQIELIIHLDKQLRLQHSSASEWTYDFLRSLLEKVPPQTSMAVYGRGPDWLYGALALHAGKETFYQYDARLGWVRILDLQIGPPSPQSNALLHIDQPYVDDEQYVLEMHPPHNYIDYTDADKLRFPTPPPNRGVIVSGKLPLWLFTSLARLYKQLDVPWLALTYAHNNTAIVIHSRVDKHKIGDPLPMPV